MGLEEVTGKLILLCAWNTDTHKVLEVSWELLHPQRKKYKEN